MNIDNTKRCSIRLVLLLLLGIDAPTGPARMLFRRFIDLSVHIIGQTQIITLCRDEEHE